MEKPNIYKKSYPHVFFNTQKFDILGTSLFSSDLENLVPEQRRNWSLNESYKALCHVIHLHCAFWEPQKQGRHPVWEPKPPSNHCLNESLECSASSFIFSVPPGNQRNSSWRHTPSRNQAHPVLDPMERSASEPSHPSPGSCLLHCTWRTSWLRKQMPSLKMTATLKNDVSCPCLGETQSDSMFTEQLGLPTTAWAKPVRYNHVSLQACICTNAFHSPCVKNLGCLQLWHW